MNAKDIDDIRTIPVGNYQMTVGLDYSHNTVHILGDNMASTNAIEYAQVAKLAYDTVQEVMRQGEADGKSGWDTEWYTEGHLAHAGQHIIELSENGCNADTSDEEHLRHALTRIAMAYYLWLKEQRERDE